MILLVTYDLKVVKDYTPFYDALKSLGPWWHYISSTWLVDTLRAPEDVLSVVRPHLSPQDFLLIVEIGPRYQGLLPKEAWEWINARLSGQYFNPILPFLPNTIPTAK